MSYTATHQPGQVTEESRDGGATWQVVAPGDPLSDGAQYRLTIGACPMAEGAPEVVSEPEWISGVMVFR